MSALLEIRPENCGHIPIPDYSPRFWFQWENYVVIEPVPDKVYSLKLFVSDYPTTELTATTDCPASLPEEFRECIVDYAIFLLAIKLHKWRTAVRAYNRYIREMAIRKKEYLSRRIDRLEDRKIPN